MVLLITLQITQHKQDVQETHDVQLQQNPQKQTNM
jgi:hypothetical protein